MAFIDEVRMMMPWLPNHIIRSYVEGFEEYGDSDLAWAYVRSQPNYDSWVPGNRRDDGTLRFTELEYFSNMDAYRNVVRSTGIDPNLFESRGEFVKLIEGEVSPAEFGTRVDQMFERVLISAPEVQEEYSRFWDVPMTAHAMLASLMSPEIGTAILERQISMAEVSAEGVQHGFGDLAQRYVRDLVHQGVTQSSAQQFFAQAESMIPTLSALVARHEDPSDEFDLEDFTAATIYDDPFQRSRMRRVVASEQALFSTATGETQWQRLGGPGGRILTGLGQI